MWISHRYDLYELDKYKVLALPMVFICSRKVFMKSLCICGNGGVLISATGQVRMIQTDAIWRNSTWSDGCTGIRSAEIDGLL